MDLTEKTKNRLLHGYATCVASMTFLLIVAGALVTSNDAGLSVPDWPTSFGSFRMPPMVGGVKYEHGHRMVAGTVVMLTVILAFWLWLSEERPWVRRLGGLALLTIIAQATLGGITVLFFLPVDISVAHACLAQLFFCIMVSIALFTSPDWRWDEPRLEDPTRPSFRLLAVATTVVIVLQLLLGAAFRHHGLGIIPHILGAAAVTISVLWLLRRVRALRHEARQLERPVLLMAGLLSVQIVLGAISYVLRLQAVGAAQPLLAVVAVTTAHVAAGALLLASSLFVTFSVYRFTKIPRQSRIGDVLGVTRAGA